MERGTAIWIVLAPKLAAVSSDDRTTDGQSESKASFFWLVRR